MISGVTPRYWGKLLTASAKEGNSCKYQDWHFFRMFFIII